MELVLLCCLALCHVATALQLAPSLVNTTHGPVMGVVTDSYRFFKGIPYAAPPVGDLRFVRAQPPKAWTNVLNASQYGSPCVQTSGMLQGQEDCLFVNVFTPPTISKPLPVMVWIHGGGFQTGAGSEYDGVKFSQKGVVVVTLNYRLGALGYLQLNEIAGQDPSWPSLGGMNGIVDQLSALTWVNRNIHSFGGDPNQVTIFGESAGSLSVCYLVGASTHASGLFHRAMMESGSCIGPWGAAPKALGLSNTGAYLKALSVSTMQQLRALSVAQLKAPSKQYSNVLPAVDMVLYKELPVFVYRSGAPLALPKGGAVLIGSNTQDTLFGPPYYNGPFPTSATAYTANVQEYLKNDSQAVLQLWPPQVGTANEKLWVTLSADTCVICPTQWLANILSSRGHRTFVYTYAYNPDTTLFFGAPHAAELGNVWGSPIGFPFNQSLSDRMMDYWSSFGIAGVPRTTLSGAPAQWPVYMAASNLSTASYVLFNTPTVTVQSGYHVAKCGLLNQLAIKSMASFFNIVDFCVQRQLT